MEISRTTALEVKDGELYYRVGDVLEKADPEVVARFYDSMQYNLALLVGAHATEYSNVIKELIGEEKFKEMFWPIEFIDSRS